MTPERIAELRTHITVLPGIEWSPLMADFAECLDEIERLNKFDEFRQYPPFRIEALRGMLPIRGKSNSKCWENALDEIERMQHEIERLQQDNLKLQAQLPRDDETEDDDDQPGICCVCGEFSVGRDLDDKLYCAAHYRTPGVF